MKTNEKKRISCAWKAAGGEKQVKTKERYGEVDRKRRGNFLLGCAGVSGNRRGTDGLYGVVFVSQTENLEQRTKDRNVALN